MTSPESVDYLGMELQLNARDSDNRAYFSYCHQGDFRLQRCAHCGLLRYPPSPSCPWCAHALSDWTAVEGKGTVYSYMEVCHPIQPAFRAYAPFLILLVELDTQRGRPTEHEALRVIGNLVDADGKPMTGDTTVGIGSRVRMMFTPVADGLALPQWVLDEDAEPAAEPWRYPG